MWMGTGDGDGGEYGGRRNPKLGAERAAATATDADGVGMDEGRRCDRVGCTTVGPSQSGVWSVGEANPGKDATGTTHREVAGERAGVRA